MASTKLLAVYSRGLTLVMRVLPFALLVSLLYALGWYWGGVLVMEGIGRVGASGAEALETAQTLCAGAAGLLGLYTVLQIIRRDHVSRASWWPSLFVLPFVAWTAMFVLWPREGGLDYGPLVPALHWMAWNLAYASIAGSALASAWVLAFHAVRTEGSYGFAAIAGASVRRTPELAFTVGAREHAVTIGLQVVIPGVWYALTLAFAGFVAVLDPGRRPLAFSTRLARGIMGSLFRVYFVGFLISMGFLVVLTTATVGIEQLVTVILAVTPTVLGAPFAIAWTTVSVLVWGVVTGGLYDVYIDRRTRADARDAEATAVTT